MITNKDIYLPSSIGYPVPMQLLPDLARFLGREHLPGPEVFKMIWDYIKSRNLQNPADKREIVCDEHLEKLFKKKKINMFKMSKALQQVRITC